MKRRFQRTAGVLLLPLLVLSGHAYAGSHDFIKKPFSKQLPAGWTPAGRGGGRALPRAPADPDPPIDDLMGAIRSLAVKDVVAYDFETQGFLTLNAMTGAVYMELDAGHGVSYDTSKLSALLDGQFELPTVNPIELAVSALGNLKVTRESNYEEQRRKAFDDNPGADVYFASQRFVDWASPETAAAYTAMAVLSLGATVSGSIDESVRRLMLEYQDAFAWLKLAGQQQMEDAAACLLGQMLGQSCQPFEGMSLSVNPVAVDVTYKAEPDGLSGIVFTPVMSSGTPAIQQSIPHLGFDAVVSGGSDRNTMLQGAIDQFDHLQMSAADEAGNVFQAALSRITPASDEVRKIFDAIDYAKFAADSLRAGLAQKLLSVLGLDSATLRQAYQQGNPILDLSQTQVARNLEDRLRDFAQGNARSARVDKLELDLSTYGLSARVSLHHRQEWGSLDEALDQVKGWAGQIGGGLEHAVSLVGAGASHAGEVISGGASHAGGVISGGASHAGEVISGGASHAGGVISGGTSHAGGVISGLTHGIGL